MVTKKKDSAHTKSLKPPALRSCASCAKRFTTLWCARCNTCYCSSACQVAHWACGHKKECKGIARARRDANLEVQSRALARASHMSCLLFILDIAAVYLTNREKFRGVLLASKEVRTEVLQHVKVGMNLRSSASYKAIASLFACRQLVALEIWSPAEQTDATSDDMVFTLPEQIGNCTALKMLKLTNTYFIKALPERLGDCVALTTLGLGYCHSLTALPERLGDCVALTTLDLRYSYSLTTLPERLGDCTALTTLDLSYCRGLSALPVRLGNCAALATLDLRACAHLPRHLGVVERLTARGCEVLR